MPSSWGNPWIQPGLDPNTYPAAPKLSLQSAPHPPDREQTSQLASLAGTWVTVGRWPHSFSSGVSDLWLGFLRDPLVLNWTSPPPQSLLRAVVPVGGTLGSTGGETGQGRTGMTWVTLWGWAPSPTSQGPLVHGKSINRLSKTREV